MTENGAETDPFVVLVADDDEDDWEFIGNALLEVGANTARFVHDGQELLDYLRREGIHSDRPKRDHPDLVLLDLKMHKMDGAEALSEIRADPDLMRLPIVVLTTATSEDIVNDSYDRGANSVISKPSSFIGLVEVLRAVRAYWGVVRPATTKPRFTATAWVEEIARVPVPVPTVKQKQPPSRWKRSEG